MTCAESANLADPTKRDHWMFGAGYDIVEVFAHLPCTTLMAWTFSRRICPGMELAEREIFLAVSHLLWAYKMEELADEPIDLKEYDGISGRSPVPNRIKLTPRDEHVATLLGIW